MTLVRRLVTAVRRNTLRRGIGLRLRQLACTPIPHPGDHYLKLGDAHRRFTAGGTRAVLRRITERPMSFSIDVVSTCNLACPTCPVANWPVESWRCICAVSRMDATRNKIASYLDTPLELVQARKKNHNLCTTCMAGGLPLLAIAVEGDG